MKYRVLIREVGERNRWVEIDADSRELAGERALDVQYINPKWEPWRVVNGPEVIQCEEIAKGE